MAVVDPTPRPHHLRDVVFAVASLTLLGGVLWFGVRDYYQDWKQAQRQFREVEAVRSERAFLEAVPEDVDQYTQAQSEVRLAREVVQKVQARAVNVEATAELTEKDDNGKITKSESKTYPARIVNRRVVFAVPQVDGSATLQELRDGQLVTLKGVPSSSSSDIQVTLARAEDALKSANDRLRKITDNLDRFAREVIAQKGSQSDNLRWLGGFAAPTQVHNIVLSDLPLNPGKPQEGSRLDRCTTCHLGIDLHSYDRTALAELARVQKGAQRRLRIARTIFEARIKNGENLGFDPAQLPRKVRTMSLTSAQVGEFAAHPRLDLFVGADSPHSVTRFGCTVCHAGEGTAVDFTLAGHTPNDAFQDRQWRQEHQVTAIQGSAMEAKRFVESSCLKCHPQVTDLIREGVKEEAPKLLKGYNLVRELGCFGCHDITGYKDGRPIGPDMRLEPAATAGQRVAGDDDPTLPPGTYRKAGPSLRKLADKTGEEWTRRWLLAPRGFRPDTRMPHFYNLENNSAQSLSGTGQEKFPDAEINAIASYLFQQSERAKGDKQIVFDSDGRAVPLPPAADMKDKEVLVRARNLFTEKGCLACHAHEGTAKSLADRDKQARITSDAHFGPDLSRLAGKLTGANGAEPGRRWLVQWLLNPNLYHARTRMPVTFLEPQEAGEIADWLLSQPDPALDDVRIQVSRIEGLIGKEIDVDEKEKALLVAERKERGELRQALANACHGLSAFARAWTPYNLAEVDAEADKLEQTLAQLKAPCEAYEVGIEQLQQAIRMKWPLETLQKALTDKYQALLAEKQQALLDALPVVMEAAKALFQTTKKPFPTTDEATLRQLAEVYGIGPQEKPYSVDYLKSYIGQKSIARLGCYGCHDIAGFESTRPVGGGLNDWGRKPTEQLAFENSAAYVRENYHITPLRSTRQDLEQRIRKLDRPARIRELEARGQSSAKLLDEERVELKSLKERGPLTEEEKRELITLKNVLDKDPWQAKSADGKPPFEKWFYEALEHRNREGFLNLKLADPRSYDFLQKPAWNERLRMPRYRFAGAVKRRPGETDEAYADRVDKEEAEGREAVMTFVLGQVAEPMPLTYVNRPDADRQAEITGRQVLDKYNCAGCHVIRSGLFELKPSEETQARLIERYKPDLNDFVARDHNAWTPRPSKRADEMRVFGMPWPAGKPRFNARDPGEEGRPLVVRLTEALRVQGPDGTSVAIPAGDEVRLPYGELQSRHDPYGGAFVEMMFAYVRKKRPEERIDSSAGDDPPTEDRDKARNFLPPPLLREGERVQPEWLYRFLLHPQPIRSYTILRMPRFNMSAEEARALVDYFNGVSRLENPSANLPRTYADLPQRDPAFWENQNNAYLRRLKENKALDGRIADMKPGWKLLFEERRSAMDRQMELMKGIVETEQKPALLALNQARTAGTNAVVALVLGRSDLTPTAAAWTSLLEAEKAIKPAEEAFKKVQESDNLARLVNLEKLRKEMTWETAVEEMKPDYEKNAYAADGYRLLMGHGGNICLSCHQVGNVGTPGVAPRLDRVSDRLRPEWLEHWLGRPARMLAYSPKMNANFQHGETTSQNLFVGTSSEQIMALRDVLLHYPWVAELPVNRYYAVPGKFYLDAIPKEVSK